ncbi:DUF2804 domain-containing protein [Pseudomonas sp. 30_B]|uniref:DUF2804 domain-containing protein n=1 Tax=Pseudomonas sp. 30_B TaxID=2813575 RepID=UPI001A9E7F6F|nr:DUF2804 domain-containing protein [Pseudomonas sp. 30_B]
MNTFTHVPPYANARPLCDARGRLNDAAIGWSSRPQTVCRLPGNPGRRKRWNHWCINAPGWMLSLTIADLDYLGYGAIYFLDLESGRSVHRTQITPLGRGCELPDVPNQSHSFQHGDLSLSFVEQPGQLRITASAPDLGGQPLDLALEVQRPAHLESVNLVVPMAGQCFHACSRQMGLPVRGSLQLGRRVYPCSVGESFAALDFGRGVWPFRSHWTRAAFAAPGGIAGNFGSGWTDHTPLKENALWFGGELQRLEHDVEIQQTPHDPLAPWRLRSPCERVDLTFTPRKLHRACPRLGPLYAETSQWFGHFDGSLRSLDGEHVPVREALGWVGATQARW